MLLDLRSVEDGGVIPVAPPRPVVVAPKAARRFRSPLPFVPNRRDVEQSEVENHNAEVEGIVRAFMANKRRLH